MGRGFEIKREEGGEKFSKFSQYERSSLKAIERGGGFFPIIFVTDCLKKSEKMQSGTPRYS